MGTICYATPAMRECITAIWLSCFNEKPGAIGLFFNLHFRSQDTLVYLVDEQPVAMVHMLPTHVNHAGVLLQAHYIYAAATCPAHRGKGYMGALLDYAARVGAERGDKYSLLLPSEDSLYDYYSKAGYVTHFETRFVTLTRNELAALASGHQSVAIDLNPAQLEELRTAHLKPYNGAVLWGQQAIAYAVGVAELYDGQLVSSLGAQGPSYALCGAICDGQCEVVELVCTPQNLPTLLAALLAQISAATFQFRLPTNSPLFAGQGTTSRFGMLRPLSSENVSLPKNSYLGLTLD